jgi:hypothetical protein
MYILYNPDRKDEFVVNSAGERCVIKPTWSIFRIYPRICLADLKPAGRGREGGKVRTRSVLLYDTVRCYN